MTNLEMWATILGVVMPPLIAIVQQPKWAGWLRATATVIICIIVGFVNVWINGNLHKGDDLVHSMLLVFVATIAAYKGFWKPSGISDSIRTKTSPNPPA